MIDEMTCAFDSPGSMSAFLIIALLFRDQTKWARGRFGPEATELCRAGVLCALALRSELVGCGVRQGHDGCYLARQPECKLNAKWANSENVLGTSVFRVPEMRNVVSHYRALGISALMWALLGLSGKELGKQTPCKHMKGNMAEESSLHVDGVACQLRSRAGDNKELLI